MSKFRKISVFVVAVIVTIGVAYVLGVAAAGIVQKVRTNRARAKQTEDILKKMGSGLAVGVTLPDADLEDLSGNPVKLSDLVGPKSLVAIFSPSCSYSLAELQMIKEASADAGEEANFIMISDTDPTELMYVQDSLQLQCHLLYDRDGKYRSKLNVFSYPFNFIVDQSLVIKEIIVGMTDQGKLEEIIKENRQS